MAKFIKAFTKKNTILALFSWLKCRLGIWIKHPLVLKEGNVTYIGCWPGFKPQDYFLHLFFKHSVQPIVVLGPFPYHRRFPIALEILRTIQYGRVDFFVTAENVRPRFIWAKKQIGFWHSFPSSSKIFRFPYWMYHLEWPNIDNQPTYKRYGTRLSIPRLMSPINENYSPDQLTSRHKRAVFICSYLDRRRHYLYSLVKSILGCDGYGYAFGDDCYVNAKMPIMQKYMFAFCPENSSGDGYITEKIPEAFHSGCIPITWCHPDNLSIDFNPNAVINLYGLNHLQIQALLIELASGGSMYQTRLCTPLLLKEPSLNALKKFIYL